MIMRTMSHYYNYGASKMQTELLNYNERQKPHFNNVRVVVQTEKKNIYNQS